MTNATEEPAPEITGYHAHIYFDSETEPAAQALRTDATDAAELARMVAPPGPKSGDRAK